jgi:hypothetical protein
MPHFALKYALWTVPSLHAGTGRSPVQRIHSIEIDGTVTDLKRPRGLWHSADNLRAEPLVCVIPRANFTTELAFRSSLESDVWHSAVCLRADCHRSYTPARFVAFRGQFERVA